MHPRPEADAPLPPAVRREHAQILEEDALEIVDAHRIHRQRSAQLAQAPVCIALHAFEKGRRGLKTMASRAVINGTLEVSSNKCCYSSTIMGECIATATECEPPFYPVYLRAANGSPILQIAQDRFEIANDDLIKFSHSAQACVDADLPDIMAVAPSDAFLTSIFFLGLMIGIFAVFAGKWTKNQVDRTYRNKFVGSSPLSERV